MLEFNANTVLMNARSSSTADLLDRVTVYRNQMESEAVAIFEAELRARGVSAAEIVDHGERVKEGVVVWADGTVPACSFCRAPAVVEGWGWQWLWGKVPLFPRRLRWCREHRG